MQIVLSKTYYVPTSITYLNVNNILMVKVSSDIGVGFKSLRSLYVGILNDLFIFDRHNTRELIRYML